MCCFIWLITNIWDTLTSLHTKPTSTTKHKVQLIKLLTSKFISLQLKIFNCNHTSNWFLSVDILTKIGGIEISQSTVPLKIAINRWMRNEYVGTRTEVLSDKGNHIHRRDL